MTNEHPNDLDIQHFILDKGNCEAAVIAHIGQCPVCTQKVVEYSTLFKAIKLQEKPAFNFPLADLVVARLPVHRQHDRFDTLILCIVVVALLVLAGAIFYLFQNARLNIDWDINSLSIALIITTIVGMSAFLVIDMYRKYQKQMNSIA